MLKRRCVYKGDEKFIVLIILIGVYKSKKENYNYEAKNLAIFSSSMLCATNVPKSMCFDDSSTRLRITR